MRKKFSKRILSLFLAITMILSMSSMVYALDSTEITGFDAIPDVSAGTVSNPTYATTSAIVAVLPATVTASAVSTTDEAVSVPVDSWVDTDGYDPTVDGSYTFTASLGAIQAGYINPNSLTATVEVVLLPAPPTGESFDILGGLVGETSNPLRFLVGSQGSMAAYVYDPTNDEEGPDDEGYVYQYYSEDSWGSTFYCKDGDADLQFGTPYYNELEQFGEGSQTYVDDNTIKTEWLLYNGQIKITQTVLYIPGQDKVEKKWQIQNLSDATFTDLRFLHGGDAYFDGDDYARSYYDSSQKMVYLKNFDMSKSGIMSFVGSVNSPAVHYVAGNYSDDVYENMTSFPPRLPDTTNPEYIDAGYALEWDKATLNAGSSWTITSYERFSQQGYVQVISPANKTATAGAIVPLEFTIQNFLEDSDTFDLSVSSLKGWATNIRNADNQSISSISVDGNAGIQKVYVDVTVPEDVQSDVYDTITLNVVSTSDSAITGYGSATVIAGDPEYGVPDAPTGVTAIAGNGQAVVSFTPPAYNGGSDITRYTVTASPGGITASGITSPIPITGLTNGIAYTVTVVATNESGDSLASIISAPVTPVAPVTPSSHSHSSSSSTTKTPVVNMLRFNIGVSDAYLTSGSAVETRIPMDTAPILVENRTLLPIKYVVEPLGGTILWDQNEKKVTITRGTTTIELWIGNNTAKVNGVEKLIDPDNKNVTPILADPGRTMLPIRFVSEALGCEVDWDQSTQKITVSNWK